MFSPDGRVVMGFKKKFNAWEFPGGKIEPNEPIVDGSLRELREETAIRPEKYEFIEFLDHPKWICFGFTGVTYTTPVLMEPDKHDDWSLFEFSEVQTLLRLDRVTKVTAIIANKWILAGLYRCSERGWLDLP